MGNPKYRGALLERAVAMVRPSIHVIIVNWNSGKQLVECLESFASVADDAVSLARVTVVDNASTDGSLDEATRLTATLPLAIIRNRDNIGFAAACNQGAAGSTADFLLFLNPDTRLTPGSLAAPAQFLSDRANETTGIVGIQLVDSDGIVARSCARRPRPLAMIGQSLGLDRLVPSVFPPHFLTDWDHRQTRSVDQVMGAFCFIRRPLFQALGGFDERFFVYYEDVDLAVRAQAHGRQSVYLATAQAYHRGGGTTASVKDRRLYYFLRSRILFGLKHFGRGAAIALIIATLVVEPAVRMVHALWSRRLAEVGEIARAVAMLWRHLPDIVQTHLRLAHAQRAVAHAL
jgi:N-acetylglucosaminyl-diphospho-decaprenol L-rhamnosyltransferase